MRISDWSSDVCSSDLAAALAARFAPTFPPNYRNLYNPEEAARDIWRLRDLDADNPRSVRLARKSLDGDDRLRLKVYSAVGPLALRSEEHTSELQSLMRISYAVFCLKKKKKT